MTLDRDAQRVLDHIDVDELVITYGPGISVGGGNFGMRIATLVTGAQLYALTAFQLCNQDRRS